MKHRWHIVTGLVLSAVLLWWALRDVSLASVWTEIRSAHLGLLLLAAAVQTAGFAIRAARWGVLLRPALARPRYRPRFAATTIGFMANNVLPARVGEFARALALSRLERLGFSASLGSLVVERLLDALVLATFVALPLWWPGTIGGGGGTGLRTTLSAQLGLLLPLFAGALAGLALFVWRPDLIARAVRAVVGRLFVRSLGERLGLAVESFARGLGVLKRPRLLVASLAWSVGHWLWGGLAFFVAMLAFEIDGPGYLGALFLQGVNGFVVAIPSAPGFFGPFEASVRLALTPFGVALEKQVGYAVGFHLAAFFPVTFIGFYYLWRLGLSWREVEHSEEIIEEATA